MFEMKQLPFELSALEPYMSSKTLDFHYNKHYKAYVDKLNELIKDTDYADMSLEAIIKESYYRPSDKAIYNNAGQVWNHQFFWNSLSDAGARMPAEKFVKQIEASYKSYENFAKEFEVSLIAAALRLRELGYYVGYIEV